MRTFKVSTIITAGGSSERFGSNKLLEIINNKTVLETAIEKFLPHSDEVIVVTSQKVQKKIKIKDKKIKFTLGGKTRQESVYNGLTTCIYRDLVLIHDGARPFVPEEIITETIEQVKKRRAVVVGVPVVDTIKMCSSDGRIIATPPRERLFCAQTPQAFRYTEIFEAHLRFKGENFTDDSSMLERMGVRVFLIPGSIENRKITFRKDL